MTREGLLAGAAARERARGGFSYMRDNGWASPFAPALPWRASYRLGVGGLLARRQSGPPARRAEDRRFS
jgi:hypothetical protein